MHLETLMDLLHEQLTDLYDAEHQLMDALQQMSSAAGSAMLKQAFENHLGETRQHISRLEQVMQMMGHQAERKTCKAMQGIIKEGQEMVRMRGGQDVKDAGLIAAAQRAEHYEIAGYGTAMAYAKQLGLDSAINLLGQTLQEEKMTDEKLTQLAESSINIRAAQ